MRANNVKKIWADGGLVVNAWLGIPSSVSAEVMAHAPFDSVTVDMQHGLVELQAAFSMLQAISTTDKTPLARVNWNDPAPIMKTLDAGAYGIICPMINTREETERFVGACRYAPAGYRSFGPPRGLLYGGPDYGDKANETILTFAMIETQQAMDNLDDILTTPGLDAIYIGPSDLAISLGYKPAGDPSEPAVLDAISTIMAAAKKHNVVGGIHCADGAMVARMAKEGFQFCTISNDVRLMAAKSAEEVAAARGQ